MLDKALGGGFDDPPVQSAYAFRAAMSAMARPGRFEQISGAIAPDPVSRAAGTLLLTLCDPETPLFLGHSHDTRDLRDWISFHIGAPIVERAHAQFALGDWGSLAPISAFPVGTPEYPDRSTTFIVEMPGLTPDGARLTGPGIRTEAHLSLPETDAFRRNRALFPLGHDFFFTAGERLAALPRSIRVEDR